MFIIVNKTRASAIKPVYFPIICVAVANLISKLRAKKGVHLYKSFGYLIDSAILANAFNFSFSFFIYIRNIIIKIQLPV